MNSDQLQELSFKVDNRAWHSARNCVFPQEIVLRLEQKSRVQTTIVASHSKIISQAVEVSTINLHLAH